MHTPDPPNGTVGRRRGGGENGLAEHRPRQDGRGHLTKADEDAIRDIELRFNEAWGRHDADGMVETLVDDAQFVTVNGAWTKTRAEFRDLMQRLHGANG